MRTTLIALVLVSTVGISLLVHKKKEKTPVIHVHLESIETDGFTVEYK